MQRSDWHGVIPAITTPFDESLEIDHGFLADHARWMIDAGCTGIVAPGSLGEAATLSHVEKLALIETLVKSVGDRVPIIGTISALGTAEAVRLAREMRDVGCRGLMVLPPYVYQGTWREIHGHFAAVLEATELSAMIYNNPIAYGTDLLPKQIAELAREHENVHAVKESSGDIRRITSLRAILGDRLAIFAGIDDVIVEAIDAGATGWIAGLVNALPGESVRLFELALATRDDPSRRAERDELYHWFLPMLRLDAVPEFVHLVKLVQQEFGRGSERVRPPRLPLSGEWRDRALMAIGEAKAGAD